MKIRNILIYLIIFIILGAFYYVYDVRLAQKETELKESEHRIFSLKFENIKGMTYKNKDQEIVLVRESAEDWHIAKPIDTPAERWAVEGVIRGLLDAEKEQILENVKDMAQYGLDQPQLEVTFMDGDRPLAPTLYIGDTEPSGYMSYARLGNSSEVFTVISAVRYDMSKTLFELRDKSMVLLPGEKIDRLEIEQGGNIVELKRLGIRRWDVVKPQQTPADDDLVQKIVYSALKSRVTALTAPDQPPADDAEGYGFETPQVKITVYAQGKPPVQVEIGRALKRPENKSGETPETAEEEPKEKPGYWAKSSERNDIMIVPADAVKVLQTDFDQIRDKRILGRRDLRVLSQITVKRGDRLFHAKKANDIWDITSPPEPKSQDRQVEEFLGNLETVRFEQSIPADEQSLAEYGLNQSDATIELVTPQETVEIKMNLKTRDDGLMAVRVDQGPVNLVKKQDMFKKLPVEVQDVLGDKDNKG